MSTTDDQVYQIVATIPRGRCASYGAVGACVDPPISGYLTGRAMARAPEGCPWWRVVGKDGALPIHKRSPQHAEEQLARLRKEQVVPIDGRVPAECMMSVEELEGRWTSEKPDPAS